MSIIRRRKSVAIGIDPTGSLKTNTTTDKAAFDHYWGENPLSTGIAVALQTIFR
jgi:hypothetical protein